MLRTHRTAANRAKVWVMNSIRILTALLLLSTGAASPVIAMPLAYDAGRINLSGQYAGSVSDSVLGSGTAVANFVEGDGGLGGWFGFTFGSSAYDNPALAGRSPRGISGTFEATVGSAACRFKFHARFDRAKYALRGDYEATNGACMDESGSFTLKQQCYYQFDVDVRRDGGPMHC